MAMRGIREPQECREVINYPSHGRPSLSPSRKPTWLPFEEDSVWSTKSGTLSIQFVLFSLQMEGLFELLQHQY